MNLLRFDLLFVRRKRWVGPCPREIPWCPAVPGEFQVARGNRFHQQCAQRKRQFTSLWQTQSLIVVQRRRPGVYRGSKQRIPNAEYGGEIAIAPTPVDRMVGGMIPRRDNQACDKALDGIGKIDVAVVELRTQADEHLEREPGHSSRPPDQHPTGFREPREQEFAGMEAQRGCGIDGGVGVVRLVETPQQRDPVVGAVSDAVERVQRHHRQDDFGPPGESEPARDTPTLLLHMDRPQQERHIQQQSHEHGVEDGNSGVKAETPPARLAPRARRRERFEHHAHAESAKEDDELAGVEIDLQGKRGRWAGRVWLPGGYLGSVPKSQPLRRAKGPVETPAPAAYRYPGPRPACHGMALSTPALISGETMAIGRGSGCVGDSVARVTRIE